MPNGWDAVRRARFSPSVKFFIQGKNHDYNCSTLITQGREMKAVKIAVLASVASAMLAGGAVQAAAPKKELPPKPSVGDIVKEAKAAD
jgi:hypothetical protein